MNSKIAGYTALERLEPCAGKLACMVLRGADSSNVVGLLDFTFIARQKRIIIDNEDFHIDLLFFHRDLRRLVAIELKLGDFKSGYKSQMELYLRWLDKYERRSEEESPIGLILCAGKKKEQIELLELDRSGIHVAEYLTVLPSKEVLRERLHKAIKQARQRLENEVVEEARL
jgi:YhcG PDDEXK nuclease domain